MTRSPQRRIEKRCTPVALNVQQTIDAGPILNVGIERVAHLARWPQCASAAVAYHFANSRPNNLPPALLPVRARGACSLLSATVATSANGGAGWTTGHSIPPSTARLTRRDGWRFRPR